MATEVSVLARIRGALRDVYSTGDQRPVAADGGELIVVQGMPELTDVVRQGNSWQVANASGQAALTALPTTVAGLSLYNGEAGNGKSYVIDSFGAWDGVVDVTQYNTVAIFAMMNVAGSFAVPTATALTKQGLSGKLYNGKARSIAGLTVTNDGWFPHGNLAVNPSAGAGGLIWHVHEVQARGLYVVPPGGMFNIQAVKALAAAAAQQFFFVRWHELQLALG